MNRTKAKEIAARHPGLAAEFLMRYVKGQQDIDGLVNDLAILCELSEQRLQKLSEQNERLMTGIKKLKQGNEEILANVKLLIDNKAKNTP